MDSKLKARLGGLFIFALSMGFLVYAWHVRLTEATYMPKANFLFPVFLFLGLALMVYPITKAESLAKYGQEQMPWRHLPLGMKILVGVGFLAGALNWALISGRF
jgi:hypothetical protein